MPVINRPRTNEERDIALRTGKARKDTIPAPLVIPYTAATTARIDLVQPVYRSKYLAVSTAKNIQTALTAATVSAERIAWFHVQDFVENLNRAIRREILLATDRNYYGIAIHDSSTPHISSEAQLVTWGQNLSDGEAARVAAGGTPITWPSIGEVNTAIATYTTLNDQQSAAKEAYDAAQETLEADEETTDKLILKMWNETETCFDEGDKPSMRRKARLWGVVYTPNAGEALNPDDFSIVGIVTDSLSGLSIENAAVVLVSPEVIVLTDVHGRYLIPVQPAGTYALHIHKDGYTDTDVTGVVVVAGAITTRDVQLVATGLGTVEGSVTQGGSALVANISVDGLPGGITTDVFGNFTYLNIPSGPQVIHATSVANPAITASQSINVVAGTSVIVNFVFA